MLSQVVYFIWTYVSLYRRSYWSASIILLWFCSIISSLSLRLSFLPKVVLSVTMRVFWAVGVLENGINESSNPFTGLFTRYNTSFSHYSSIYQGATILYFARPEVVCVGGGDPFNLHTWICLYGFGKSQHLFIIHSSLHSEPQHDILTYTRVLCLSVKVYLICIFESTYLVGLIHSPFH